MTMQPEISGKKNHKCDNLFFVQIILVVYETFGSDLPNKIHVEVVTEQAFHCRHSLASSQSHPNEDPPYLLIGPGSLIFP